MPPQVATESNVGDDIVADPERRDASPEPEPHPGAEGVDPPAPEPYDQDGLGDSTGTEQRVVAADLGVTELEADPDEPAAPAVPTTTSSRSVRQRIRARQLRARKVRRTIRHIDPWSVVKFSVFFFALAWMVLIMAGVVLWSLAVNSGLVTDFEDLVIELFDLTSFAVDPDLMFRVSVMVGGAMALGGALFMGVLAVLFNLLSDLLGGIRVSVIEEETARRIVE
mgnify:FL=1